MPPQCFVYIPLIWPMIQNLPNATKPINIIIIIIVVVSVAAAAAAAFHVVVIIKCGHLLAMHHFQLRSAIIQCIRLFYDTR